MILNPEPEAHVFNLFVVSCVFGPRQAPHLSLLKIQEEASPKWIKLKSFVRLYFAGIACMLEPRADPCMHYLLKIVERVRPDFAGKSKGETPCLD